MDGHLEEYADKRKSINILIAEDNRVNQLIIKMTLEKAGFNCVTTANGKEALKMLLDGNYDIAILDMQMPGLSGVEVCHTYKSCRPDDEQLDFIMLSANLSKDDRERALKAGFRECLPKTAEFSLLVGLLDAKAKDMADGFKLKKPA